MKLILKELWLKQNEQEKIIVSVLWIIEKYIHYVRERTLKGNLRNCMLMSS